MHVDLLVLWLINEIIQQLQMVFGLQLYYNTCQLKRFFHHLYLLSQYQLLCNILIHNYSPHALPTHPLC